MARAVLEREIDRVTRSGEAALLLMLDIDHFKKVNDVHGHLAGDIVLQSVARTLNAHDVGVYVLPPVSFNHLWALPNKVFDFVQGRLALVVGPSPEMAARSPEPAKRCAVPHSFSALAAAGSSPRLIA